MTTNLKIGYPDIPFNATSLLVTDSYSADENNVITGARSIISRATTDVAWTNEFEFASTSTSNYFGIAKASLLKKAGVTSVLLRGSSASYYTPEDVGFPVFWLDSTKFITRDETTYKVSEVLERSTYTDSYVQATTGTQPILTRADNKSNLIYYSEEIDNAAWTKTGVTITANLFADPLGISSIASVDTVIASAGAGNHYVAEISPTLGAGQTGLTYRLSAYLQYGNHQYVQILESGDGTVRTATVDLASGTISAGSGILTSSIEALGSYRYRATITFTRTTNNNLTIAIGFDNTSNSSSIASFTATGAEFFDLWGVQLNEVDADATYLKTTDKQEYQGVNGNRSLRFFGAQSLDYNLGGTPSQVDITSDLSIYAVIKPKNTNTATNYVILSCETLSASGYIFRIDPNAGNFDPVFRTSQAGANTFIRGTAGSVTINTTQILGVQRNGATSTHYLNGSSNGSGAVSDPVSATALFQVGTGSGQSFNGNICEILIFNFNLPTLARQAVENYLTSKWITAPVYQNHDLQTTTLGGPDQEDLFTTFTETSSYTHWIVTFESVTPNKRPLSKIYLGTLFDLGRDPNYDMKTTKIYLSESAPDGLLEIELSWSGITNDKRIEFDNKIGIWKRENPVYLYQTYYTGHVYDYNPIHCQLLNYQWEPIENSQNNLKCTFREIR